MKTQLLPNYFKKIGLVLFFVGFLLSGVDGFRAGFYAGLQNASEDKNDPVMSQLILEFEPYWSVGWHRLFDLCSIAGILVYALSREKREDEWYRTLRLETGWLTFIISMAGLFVIYAIWGEISLALSFLLNIPLMLFLIIFSIRKRNILSDGL